MPRKIWVSTTAFMGRFGPTLPDNLDRAGARKHNANIICPLMEKRGDVLYNVAAVIDRKGQIVGTYEKLHPVTTTPNFTEFEGGVTPGKEPRVFDLDFG